MAAVLLLSLGILVAGIAGSVVLMVRSGEIRAGLLAVCFSLLAVRQAIATYDGWGARMTLDAHGAAEAALLAASAAGLLVLIALWRSLSERDRAETEHWESMEAVRALSELAVRWDMDLDRKFDELLIAGCSRFGLEIGVISRVRRQEYEVLAIRAPDDLPITRGDRFILGDTWCDRTLRSPRPVGLERTADATPPAHAARAAFGFGAYLGAAVRVYGEVVGTVAFGSRLPRAKRFTATDKDFVHLIAQWVGTELERRLAAEERASHAAAPPRMRSQTTRSAIRGNRGVDVNRSIRRSERDLRSAFGDRAEIEFRLGDDVQGAADTRVAPGTIVASLLHAVADEIPAAGRISIATSNLDFARPETAGEPDRAGERHVTIEVVVTGSGIAANAFRRVFEAAPEDADRSVRAGRPPRISVAQIRHLLKRHGGDLSLEVEPGVAATFTLYLRCTDEARSKPNTEPSAPMRKRYAAQEIGVSDSSER